MKTLTDPFGPPALTIVQTAPVPAEPVRTSDQLASEAAVLIALARIWDDLTDDLTTRGGLTVLSAFGVLCQTAGANCHPNAAPQVGFLMVAVREATDRLARWETGALDPWEVLEDWAPGEDHEAVVAKLDADLDGALWPLLHGLPVTARCVTCVKAHDVHRQAPAVSRGLCAEHGGLVAR